MGGALFMTDRPCSHVPDHRHCYRPQVDSAAAGGSTGSAGDSGDSRPSLLPAIALLLGGALVAVAPWVGVAHSFDGSAPGRVAAAGLVMLMPALLSIAVAVTRPALGPPFVAAAGLLALARTCADVDVLVGPNDVVRPELFFQTTLRAHPFRVGPGAVVLLAGDVVMVAAGVWAARRMSLGPGEERDERQDEPARRSVGVLAIGLTGAVLASAGALLQPYRGGFLDDLLLPPALGGWSLGAALLLLVLPAGAVLVAAGLPRPVAMAVTVGAGATLVAGALVPLLVVAFGHSGLELTAAPWIGLVGGLAVVGSGFASARPAPSLTAGPSSARLAQLLDERLGVLSGVLAVLAAISAAPAFVGPSLRVDGRADGVGDWAPAPTLRYSATIDPPFAWAAFILLLAGVFALVPRVSGVGRMLAAVGWAVPGYAVAQGLARYSEISAVVPSDAAAAGVQARVWTVGPGLWWGVASFLLAAAAAVLAGMAQRRATEAVGPVDARLVDAAAANRREDDNAQRRQWRLLAATGVAACVLVAGLLPAFSAADRSAPTLGSLGLDGVGMWILVAGVILGAGLTGAATTWPPAVGGALGGVLVLGVRYLQPASLPGYRVGPGLLATGVAQLLLVLLAVTVVTVLRPIPEPVPVVRRRVKGAPAGKAR